MSHDISAPAGESQAISPMRRRTFIGVAGAATLAAGLDSMLAPSARAATTPSAAPLAYFDMSSLNSTDMSSTAAVTAAYDQLHLVSSLQGLVNRNESALFVNFIKGDQFGPIDLDQYWLGKLQESGQWLAGRPLHTIPDLDALVQEFGSRARGAVIWDPKVWATSNVATTVAGADDLVVVRYDPSPESVYTRYVTSGRFPARVWLVNPDGSSLFTGKGTIPHTGMPSTGSAKCDAYLWAKVNYLDTGRSNPSEIGYYIDAYWLTKPNIQNEDYPLPTCQLTNHDYLVANRAFLLDLSIWSDVAPEDDPGQPLGTDRRTLEAILQSAYRHAVDRHGQRDGLIALHGFVPWAFKYSSSASSTDWHNPVAAEWESIQLFSSYNIYVDADAGPGIGSLVNASLYQHYPLDRFYPQNPKPALADFRAKGYVDAAGDVAPKRYIAFYTGDYDSAAWLYHFVPRVWDEPTRGSVVMSWAFDPNLAQRMAPGLVYVRQTRSANDFFIAGDSGAGYVNPGAYESPRPDSGKPSGVDAWTRHCQDYYGRWDISLSGFNIDGFSEALSEDALAASYGRFSPGGVVGQKAYRVGMAGNLPYVRQAGDMPNEATDQAASFLQNNYVSGDTSKPPLRPEFTVVRTTLQGPTYTQDVMDKVRQDLPDAAIELVDAYTLLGLVRQHLADRITVNPQRALVAPGTPTPVLLEVVNRRRANAKVEVSLEVPQGWSVSPERLTTMLRRGEDRQASFQVTPAGSPGTMATLTAVVTGRGISERVPFTASVISDSYARAGSVSVTLGAANSSAGITQLDSSFNGPTKAAVLGGKHCRQLTIIANGFTKACFMYFDVADTFMFDEQHTGAVVTVDYFDAPGQRFWLEYDGPDTDGRPMNGIFTNGGAVTTTGSNTWKTRRFRLGRVYFGNRQMPSPDYRAPGIADFRLASEQPIAVAQITVNRT